MLIYGPEQARALTFRRVALQALPAVMQHCAAYVVRCQGSACAAARGALKQQPLRAELQQWALQKWAHEADSSAGETYPCDIMYVELCVITCRSSSVHKIFPYTTARPDCTAVGPSVNTFRLKIIWRLTPAAFGCRHLRPSLQTSHLCFIQITTSLLLLVHMLHPFLHMYAQYQATVWLKLSA